MTSATSIALDIEKSVLEKNALDHFRGDSPEVADTLEKLNSETVDHARRIETAAGSRNRNSRLAGPARPVHGVEESPSNSAVHSIRITMV